MTAYLYKVSDHTHGNAPLRMFCFHHAGGGASLYHGWQQAFSPQVEVLPVLLPGRERRIDEARFLDLDALIEDMAPQLAPYLDTPHMFFGHSMGALVAHRLACYRHAYGYSLPRMLLISSCAAPQLSSALPTKGKIEDAALLQLLKDSGGLPTQLLTQFELLAYTLPILRDDLAICSSYQHQEIPILPCPFYMFGGYADPLVSEKQLWAWSQLSRERCDLSMLPGGHFYLRDIPKLLHAEMRNLFHMNGNNRRHLFCPDFDFQLGRGIA